MRFPDSRRRATFLRIESLEERQLLTTNIIFLNNPAFSGDGAGATALVTVDGRPVTFTTLSATNELGTAGTLDTSIGLGINTDPGDGNLNQFNAHRTTLGSIGERWSFEIDTGAFVEGLNFGAVSSGEFFDVQSDAWINLSGIAPASGSVTYTSASGTFTFTDNGAGNDDFTLADMTGGTALAIPAGADVTVSFRSAAFTTDRATLDNLILSVPGSPFNLDFGDAPSAAQSGFASSYPVTIAENGARHNPAGPFLGATRDVEADGTPSANADADGADEDGVTFGALNIGGMGSATVVVGGVSSRVTIFIDLNQNGTWTDPGELVYNQVLAVGSYPITFSVPGSATAGTTFARVRAGTVESEINVPTGPAANGEVEDYKVALVAAAPVDPTSATVIGGVLTIADTDATGENNQFTLSKLNPTTFQLSDASGATIDVSSTSGAMNSGTSTVTIPTTGITSIVINGALGNDRLTVDFSGGSLGVPLTFNGGAQTVADTLALTGGTTTLVTHSFTNKNDGSVTLAGAIAGTINYTGLEPISDNLSAVDRVFAFNGGVETITVSDDPGMVANVSRIVSTFGESVDFVTPTSSLKIITNGGDTTIINGFDPAFNTPNLIFEDTTAASSFILGASNLIPDVTSLTVTGNAIFDLNGNSETINGLSGTGTVDNTQAGMAALIVGAVNGSGTFSGTIKNTAGLLSLTKTGTGTQALNALNTYTGTTNVNAGTLVVNGSLANGAADPDVLVNSGGRLGGTGTVGGTVRVNGLGSVAPGNSPGILNSGSVTFVAGSTFNVEIGGANAGNTATDHDQLNVSGTVSLGGATLVLMGAYAPLAGDDFVIINNDGTDDVIGTFAGLPEGSFVTTFNGVKLYITYAGGDGNDVVLNASPIVNGSGAADRLVLRRQNGGATDGDIEYSLNSAPFVQLNGASSFTFNGLGGDDTLVVDFINGDTIPSGGVSYDGGTQVTSPNGDVLVVDGRGANSAIYRGDAVTPGMGTIAISGAGTIGFTGLEPVDIIGMMTATISFPNADDIVSIANGFDAATSAQDAMVVSGTSGGVAFESVHLRGNTNVVLDTAIGGSEGNDTINIFSADNAHGNAHFKIAAGLGTDVVNVNGPMTFAGNVDISSQAVSFPNATSDLTVSGASTVTIDATRNIRLSAGSSIISANGSITLMANQGGSAAAGNFVGIEVNGAMIGSTNGNIRFQGRGGNGDGSDNYGVYVVGGGSIINTGSGTVTITGTGGSGSSRNHGVRLGLGGGIAVNGGALNVVGTGGAGTGDDNDGLFFDPGSSVTSSAGNVSLNGLGGGTVAAGNGRGISAFGTISVGGTGNLMMTGTGAAISGFANLGIHADGDISTAGGNITLTGIGGGVGASDDNQGMQLQGTITAGVAGTITLTGTGGVGPTANINSGILFYLNTVVQSFDGDIVVKGTSVANSFGVDFSLRPGATLRTTGAGNIEIISDALDIHPITTINAGANTVTIRPMTGGTAIDLGGPDAPGVLALTDAELDRVTAGTINIGDVNSGAITVSDSITRAVATNVNLTTAANNSITFAASGSLDANGGNVTLTTNPTGTGAIVGGASAPNVKANTLSLTAGSGGIGTSGTSLSIDAVNLNAMTGSNGNQFLSEANSVTIDATGLAAGSGTISLTGGTFTLGGPNRINDAADVSISGGATLAMGTSNETIDQLILVDGSVTGNGTLTGGSTFDVRMGSITSVLAGSGIGLTKTTSSTVTLSGVNTYSGDTTVSAGTLALSNTTTNNNIASSTPIVVAGGAVLDVTGLGSGVNAARLDLANAIGQTLQGAGTVNGDVRVQSGTTLMPGLSPAILSSGSVSFTGGTFAIEIQGPTAGSCPLCHSQLDVTGSVALGSGVAGLSLSGSYVPVAGDTFTIIDNDNAGPTDNSTGFFTSRPEGSSVGLFNGVELFITYNGGDGNDVLLTTTPTVSGLTGNDTLVLRRFDASNIEFSLNAAPFVQVTDTLPFTFNGFAGTDLMLVDPAGGDPLPTGNASFIGEILRIHGTGAETVTYTPSAVTLAGFGDVNLSGATNVDLIDVTTANVQTAALDDTLALADGNTATNGGMLPLGYSIAALANLNVTGAGATVGLRNVTNVSLTTVTGGGGGNDTVTITSGTGMHGVTNLMIDTGMGTDTVTVSGAITVGGNVDILSQNIGVNATITAGATSTVTLNAGSGAITTSGAGVDVVAQDLLATATTGIDLDTTVTNITATNSGAGNVNIDETDGANVLNVSAANGNATVTSTTGNLNVTSVSASGTATLTATAGAITDANGAGNNVSAASLVASAVTGIDLDTTVTNITATNSGAGAIVLREVDAATLNNVTAANGPITITTGGATLVTNVVSSMDNDANDISITASAGNITVVTVDAGMMAGDVTITATAGSILDDNNDATVIAGDVVTLTAAVAIGQPLTGPAVEDVDTKANSLNLATTSGGMWVTDSNAVTVTSAATVDGVIVLEAGGTMTAVNVVAGGSNRNVRLTTTAGDINVGFVSAIDDIVKLNAAGAILDGDTGPDDNDVTAASLQMMAGTGIGTGMNFLDTTVSNLAANSGSGGSWVKNTGALNITTVTAFGMTVNGVTAAGNIDLSTTGDLIVNQPVTSSGGTMNLTGGAGGAGNNITLNAAVTGTPVLINGGAGSDTIMVNITGARDITLNGLASGDNYVVNFGSLAGAVNIADSGAQIMGVNDKATLNGTAGDETFSVSETRTSLGAQKVNYTATLEELTVHGQAGNDTFNVSPSRYAVITINGGSPSYGTGVPPAAGDKLEFDLNGIVNGLATPTGSGAGMLTSNRKDVAWLDVETVAGINLPSPPIDFTLDLMTLGFQDGMPDVIELRRGNLGPPGNAGTESVQIRVGGNLLFEFSESSLRSLIVNGSADHDTLIIRETTEGFPLVNGPLSSPKNNTILGGLPSILFNGGAGIDTLRYEFNQTSGLTVDLSYAIGDGMGGGSGMGTSEGEIRLAEAAPIGRTLSHIYFTGLEPIIANGMAGGTLTILGDPNANDFVIEANGVNTRVRASTGGSPFESFEFAAGSFSSVVVNGLDGNDTFDVRGLGPGFSANLMIDGGNNVDTVSFTGPANLVTGKVTAVAENFQISSAVATGGGNILLDASGRIVVDATGQLAVQSGVGTVTLNAGLDIFMRDGSLVNAAGGNITLQGRWGVQVGRLVTTGIGMVTVISSDGGIADGGDSGGDDIVAASVVLKARTSVGMRVKTAAGISMNKLETRVGRIDVEAHGVGIFIVNSGMLIVDRAVATAPYPDGLIDITTMSPLAVSGSVRGTAVNLTASPSAAGSGPADNLTIGPSAAVRATAGAVTLSAGNNVLVAPTAVVSATAGVVINAQMATATIVTSPGAVSPWTNPVNWADVNADGRVSPIDAFLIIDALRSGRGLPSPTAIVNGAAQPMLYLDTNGDSRLTPMDAFRVIDVLRRGVTPAVNAGGQQAAGAAGEGEASAAEGESNWLPNSPPATTPSVSAKPVSQDSYLQFVDSAFAAIDDLLPNDALEPVEVKRREPIDTALEIDGVWPQFDELLFDLAEGAI